jgi:ketosteroid isomerase-like protein
MSDDERRVTIEAFVTAMNAHDLDALATLYTDDVILEWPQSGERIRGEANRREVYERFPSLPTITPTRVTGSGDHWVLEAALDYGDGAPYLGVFVLELRGERVARSVTYWSQPFPAPEWRAPWVERMDAQA